jgi:hypothetical protein
MLPAHPLIQVPCQDLPQAKGRQMRGLGFARRLDLSDQSFSSTLRRKVKTAPVLEIRATQSSMLAFRLVFLAFGMHSHLPQMRGKKLVVVDVLLGQFLRFTEDTLIAQQLEINTGKTTARPLAKSRIQGW